ncbi:DNA-binding transcriptional MerR regulator [Clostridium tetanomorphum]|uniref:MerR family transcriptional regulator n=1 Tax=Clostridium tetanomorphum TaxID=1553 RepID=A0A923J2V9_CLOTT|nr:MerR family transcriptional regulator [Clostridium tetanomorphum]KAJ50095.1 MerR family transcriptional regulator [Clostridium tetanomorphum DSM 665]MBC2399235.1 MerR family transcriptional regulator [Clostridium tetanomorphum]MBP1862840.1 DNA-binding transcriptional MerR regulator [Clostridium tetanomorphum]NRS86977.1 DNA-binding transcriptional MerR regulator [Clostridium tetanomorphum]NRZ99239.1 DNA-binding transcriptional MerR regulator [Clostridium tetanomorphum]
MKDYYKIGEISKIYNICRDSLMYYEKLGILKPIRDTNGYRLYTMNDIWKLNLIKELRTFDFSMEKINDYIDNRTVKATKEMLNEEICLINNKIEELNMLKNNVLKRIQNINSVETTTVLNTVKVIYIDERKALKLNGDISRDEEVDYLIKKLQKNYEDKFYLLGNTKVGAIYNLDSLNNGVYNKYKSVFCLLDNSESNYNLLLQGAHYVCISYRGSYSSNKQYIDKLFSFINNNNYKIISEPIEIYKIDVHETSLQEEFITEIQIPILL